MPSPIEDRLEIQDVLLRYAHAIDHDMELWDQVFTPDAELDYRIGGPERAFGAASEIKQYMLEIHATALATQHFVSNVLVSLDGDRATGRTAVRGYLVRPGTRAHLVEITDFIGYYDDDFVRTDQGWRIARRTTHVTWREYRSMA